MTLKFEVCVSHFLGDPNAAPCFSLSRLWLQLFLFFLFEAKIAAKEVSPLTCVLLSSFFGHLHGRKWESLYFVFLDRFFFFLSRDFEYLARRDVECSSRFGGDCF